MQVRADQDVLAHRQAGKRLHDLEGARDAAPRQPMRRLAGDVLAGIADRPSLGLRKPEMRENSVVLPAPLGPISAVMRPSGAASEAALTASRPPKRRETRSTTRSGSAMAGLHDRGCRRGATAFAQLRKPPIRPRGANQMTSTSTTP